MFLCHFKRMKLLSHGFHFRLLENQLHFLLRKIFHPLSKKVDTVTEHPQIIHRTSHQISAFTHTAVCTSSTLSQRPCWTDFHSLRLFATDWNQRHTNAIVPHAPSDPSRIESRLIGGRIHTSELRSTPFLTHRHTHTVSNHASYFVLWPLGAIDRGWFGAAPPC